MDIRELRYFSAVFRERNLTAAARRCFISQPSISAAITNLEAELGTTLFIRHKKGVAPTASAEQFHSVARRIIDDADAARNLFRKPSARQALTLGLMRTLDMPRTIALLKPLTAAPDITVRLVGIDETTDARIVSKSMIEADEHFIPLWVDHYVAALPPSHPLTLKDRLRTSDFAGVAKAPEGALARPREVTVESIGDTLRTRISHGSLVWTSSAEDASGPDPVLMTWCAHPASATLPKHCRPSLTTEQLGRKVSVGEKDGFVNVVRYKYYCGAGFTLDSA